MDSSFPLTASRFSGVTGVLITCFVTTPKMNSSLSAICSAHSAIDQRSGPALKFHCAGESPLVASRNACREPSSSATALSRSAWVRVCPESATVAVKTAIRNSASHFVMIYVSSLLCDLFLENQSSCARRVRYSLEAPGTGLDQSPLFECSFRAYLFALERSNKHDILAAEWQLHTTKKQSGKMERSRPRLR